MVSKHVGYLTLSGLFNCDAFLLCMCQFKLFHLLLNLLYFIIQYLCNFLFVKISRVSSKNHAKLMCCKPVMWLSHANIEISPFYGMWYKTFNTRLLFQYNSQLVFIHINWMLCLQILLIHPISCPSPPENQWLLSPCHFIHPFLIISTMLCTIWDQDWCDIISMICDIIILWHRVSQTWGYKMRSNTRKE